MSSIMIGRAGSGISGSPAPGEPINLRPPGRPARQSKASRWGLCALSAALITSLILQYSFRHGRFILFPTYDDVNYLADGLHRLQTLYDWGMAGLCSEYRVLPPHSPYASVMAFVGFALFGFHDWAPYVMNSLLALGYFLAADRLLRGAALWEKAVCFAFFAELPFVGMAVHEFRPDHAAALFTAAGVVTMFWGPFLYGSRGRRMAAGAWLGVAMLAKPPVFPQTLVMGAAALALATAADWLAAGQQPQIRRVVRAWRDVCVPFVLIPLPHYLYNYGHIFGYIHDILYGAHKETYQIKATLAEHLAYYLTGFGGQIMLGRYVWLLLALLCISGVAVAMLRRRGDIVRGAALLGMVLLAWLIPTAIRTKQQFFGLTFDTLLAFLVIYLMGRLLVAGRVRRGWARAASQVLILVAMTSGLWLFQWPTRGGNFSTGWQENRRQIVDGIFRSIVAHSTFGGALAAPAPDASIPDSEKSHAPTPVVVLCGVGDMNDGLLKYMALKEQISLKAWFNEYATTPQQMIHDFDGADFVIAAESGTGLVADFLPCSPWQDQLLATARARLDFKEIGKFTFRKTGRSLYLFMRVDPTGFTGFDTGAGMGAIEGPFPEQHLTQVRWGYGPRTTIEVVAPQDGTYDLFWCARCDFQDQIMTVTADGHEVARAAISGSYTEFASTSVPIVLKAGGHEIELYYTHWHEPGRAMAVLFKALHFTRRPSDPNDKK